MIDGQGAYAILVIGLIAVGFAYVYRTLFLFPIAAYVVALVPPVLFGLFGGPFETSVFESMVGSGVISLLIFAFVWVIVVLARRTQNKDRYWVPAVIGVPFALVVAGFAIVKVERGHFYQNATNLPVVRSEKALLDAFSRPYSERYEGVFVVGKMGKTTADPDLKKQGLAEILYYTTSKGGSSTRLVRFYLRLQEGGIIEVLAPTSIHVAWNWPDSKRGGFRVALQADDPVVVWAHPGRAVDTTGEVSGWLEAPRLIAYGDLETFKKSYGPAAAYQGQVTGAMGLVIALFALLLLLATVSACLHIRRHGGDGKSEAITVR